MNQQDEMMQELQGKLQFLYSHYRIADEDIQEWIEYLRRSGVPIIQGRLDGKDLVVDIAIPAGNG